MAPGFLERLGPRDREAFEALGTVRRFDRGDALLRRGAPPEGVAVVLAGRVRVTSSSVGGQDVILAFRGPGALLGEQGALDGLPRSASVVATEPVEALTVPGSAFRGFLDNHPRAARAVIGLLSERLRDSDRRRIEFASYGTLERLAARLVELSMDHARELEHGRPIQVAITQEELAGWTASSLESVTKSLRTLREAGWVDTGRGQLVVRDIDALVRILA